MGFKFAKWLSLHKREYNYYRLCLAPTLDRFSELFSPETRRLAEDFGARIVAHYANVATGPKTFVHGDYRAQNLFFGVGPEDSFAAINWQGSGLGSGLYDVAYFLGASVSTDVRRRIECEAVEKYHAIVRGMGTDRLTFADCWRSYRQNMLSTLVPIVLACGLLDMADPKQPDLAEAGLRRVLKASEGRNLHGAPDLIIHTTASMNRLHSPS